MCQLFGSHHPASLNPLTGIPITHQCKQVFIECLLCARYGGYSWKQRHPVLADWVSLQFWWITFPTSSLVFLITSTNMDFTSSKPGTGAIHVTISDGLCGILLLLSVFPLWEAVCSSGKDTSIWSPHPHRTDPGTDHSIRICGMEQNETGNPMLGGFSLGSTASHQQPQRPPEK